MPGGEHDGVVEFGGVEDPFVEEDDRGGEGDPCAVYPVSVFVSISCMCVHSRNVDRWVQWRLRCLRLLRLCVDNGQHGQLRVALLLARLSFFFRHLDRMYCSTCYCCQKVKGE